MRFLTEHVDVCDEAAPCDEEAEDANDVERLEVRAERKFEEEAEQNERDTEALCCFSSHDPIYFLISISVRSAPSPEFESYE